MRLRLVWTNSYKTKYSATPRSHIFWFLCSQEGGKGLLSSWACRKSNFVVAEQKATKRTFPRWTIPLQTTGSRGDVFIVRTSKPVENLGKNGLFWSRYSFVTHSIDRKPRDWGLARSACSIKHFVPRSPFQRRPSVTLWATFCAPARIWLAVIDFQNGEQQSRSGSDKKQRNRLQ